MFALTRQEKTVVIFLAGMFLTGLGINFLLKITGRGGELIAQGDYQAKININRAGREELCKIKGIGPALSGNIVSWRQAHGFFENLEALKQVKGISEYKYNQIKDFVTLE